MKLFNFDIGKFKVNSYLKTVWTDESMEHNSYRHFGVFTSRHYGGVLNYDKETGLMSKNVTYSFGVDLFCLNHKCKYKYLYETKKEYICKSCDKKRNNELIYILKITSKL